MIRILLFWVLEFLVIAGLGVLLQRAFVRRGAFGVIDTFWLGLAALVACLQILHLVAPIDGVAVLLLGGAGCAGWLISRPWRAVALSRIHSICTAKGRRRVGIALLLCLVLALFAAAHSAWERQPIGGDTSLYHWNIVRWYNGYPIVPGLANLSSRLGFNSSYLLWAAWVDNFWADRRSAELMPGFLIVVMAAQWVTTLLLGARTRPAVRIFSLLTFPYVLGLIWNLNPALYYDNAQNMAMLVLVRSLLAWHGARGESEPDSPSLAAWCGFWMALAALSFTFKLSGVLLPPFCLGISMWLLSKAEPGIWRTRKGWLGLLSIGLLPALLIVGYLARNVILSGWLLFPSPMFNLHLSWSVPESIVRQLYETDIRDWARIAGSERAEIATKGFWYWFPKWHQVFRRNTAHECLWIGIFACAFWACVPVRKRGLQRDTALPWLLLAMVGMNLVLWFTGAPDLRFAEGLFWCWMAIASACAISAWFRSSKLAWSVAAIIAIHLFLDSQTDLTPVAPFSLTKVDRAESRPVELVTVPNGQSPPLQIYLSKDPSDPSPGDSELPASLQLNPDLMWRSPGNLRAGFWQRQPQRE